MNFVFLKMIFCVDVVRNATERLLSFEATDVFVHRFCFLRLVVPVRNTNNKHFIRDKCQSIRCQLYLLCNFFGDDVDGTLPSNRSLPPISRTIILYSSAVGMKGSLSRVLPPGKERILKLGK